MNAFDDHEDREDQQAYDQGTFFGRFLKNFADTNSLLQGTKMARTITGVGASTMAMAIWTAAIGNRVMHTEV